MTLRDPGLETPLAPLPTPVASPQPPDAVPPTTAGPLTAAAAGARFALRAWRPLLAVLLVQLLLALTIAAPFQGALGARLDAHPQANADRALGWEAGIDAGLWSDAQRGLSALFESLPVALFFVLLAAWLFGAVAAGGFLQLAVEPGPMGAGRFFAGGGRWFGRMARVGVVFGGVFLLVGRIVHEGWAAAALPGEKSATSEGVFWWGERAREVALLVAFLVLRVAADLARADLVLTERRSAFLAFFRRLGSVVRHPLRTLGTAALLGMPAFAALYGLSLLLGLLPSTGWGGIAALFLVLQLAVLLRWASRAAVLAADVRLLRR